MTGFYIVEPEVAGGWGRNTEFTRRPGQPTIVRKLHYLFEGWLGDDLLETAPCYIATERLTAGIKRSRFTGVEFSPVEISKSEQFEDLYPNRELPKFLWLKAEGIPLRDDFAMTRDLQLIVSKRALDVIGNFQISHAIVKPVGDGHI